MHGRGCACRRDCYWSGLYTCYWNAFLFLVLFLFCICCIQLEPVKYDSRPMTSFDSRDPLPRCWMLHDKGNCIGCSTVEFNAFIWEFIKFICNSLHDHKSNFILMADSLKVMHKIFLPSPVSFKLAQLTEFKLDLIDGNLDCFYDLQEIYICTLRGRFTPSKT